MDGDRIPRTRVDKFAERRAELAEAALQTLATLGYARTSLREIAANSTFSHGLLHYYFTDKFDLISCSVRQYKARCAQRYDHVIDGASSGTELMDGFLAALAVTVRDDATLHRLWYDLRAQALFTEELRADVSDIDRRLEEMVWRVAARYGELADEPVRMPSSVLYAAVDGLFQQALQRQLRGDQDAAGDLQEQVRWVMAESVAAPLPVT